MTEYIEEGIRPHSPSRAAAGAPLLGPAIAYAVLTVLGLVVPRAMAGVAPWSSDSDLLEFFTQQAAAAHAAAFFTMGAAVPLTIFTAVSTTRLRTLGFDVPGRMIALTGGIIASALLAVSGLATLTLTRPHVAESAAAIRAINGLGFATGGPGFVVFQGLLLAGVSVVALIGRAMRGPIVWFGLAIAALSELAALSVAFSGLEFLLPVGRFGGLLWIVATGAVLPATRRDARFRRAHGPHQPA